VHNLIKQKKFEIAARLMSKYLDPAGPLSRNLGPERTTAIRKQLGVNVGDAAFFLAGKPRDFIKFAGAARARIGEELGLIDRDRFAFCWIVDFPMYEWNEEDKKVDFSHN